MPNLVGTPQRVVASFRELLRREPLTMTTFPNEQGYDDLVLVREIPFTSLCAHHLLPFRGVAHVGYLPATRLLGLSKLARVVEHFARDLQLQERLTVQIADYLTSELDAERRRRGARSRAPLHVHPRSADPDGANADGTIHRGARRTRVGALRRRVAMSRLVLERRRPS